MTQNNNKNHRTVITFIIVYISLIYKHVSRVSHQSILFIATNMIWFLPFSHITYFDAVVVVAWPVDVY